MQNSDREIQCVSCGQPFVFTGAEQAFFAQHSLQEPRRCKPCRAQRKAQGGASGRDRDRGGQGPARPGRGRGPMAPVYAAADDPNGYRAPGFQSEARGSYTVDYAGLPRDEEPNGNTREVGADRLGMRAPIAAGTARRGRNGHPGDRFASTDRAGTDPNAYRSPGFASPQRDTRSTAPRDPKKSRRMRHEATCADCGVAALVPFQPGPDRPAFCKDCYQVRKANGTVPRPTAALTPVPPAGNAEDNSSGSTADVATE